MMSDQQYHAHIKHLTDSIGGEWLMIKEYQRWGYCPTFRNAEGNVLFFDGGEYLTGPEMYDRLNETWRPVSHPDYNYFANGRLKRDLRAL